MPQISICRTISSSPVGLCSSWCVFLDHAKEKGTPNSITPCETGHWSLLQSPCTKRQYVHGLASWLSWHQSLLDLMHCNQKDGPDQGRAQSRDHSSHKLFTHSQGIQPHLQYQEPRPTATLFYRVERDRARKSKCLLRSRQLGQPAARL